MSSNLKPADFSLGGTHLVKTYYEHCPALRQATATTGTALGLLNHDSMPHRVIRALATFIRDRL
jgi:hypothetical protein